MERDYRTVGRTFDDLIALETIEKMPRDEQSRMALMAMEFSSKTGIDPIDSLTILMKVGQYLATHPGVKR